MTPSRPFSRPAWRLVACAFLLLAAWPAAGAGTLEILDAYGRPAATVAGELRLRLSGVVLPPWGGGQVMVELTDDVSQDADQLFLSETGPGTFESQVVPLPLAGEIWTYDGRLTAPAGSTVSARFRGGYQPEDELVVTAAAAAATVELVDGEGRPAAGYLLQEPVDLEVRDAAADLSSGRDLVTVQVATSLTGDAETVQLRETASHSGVFRGRLPAAFAAAAIPGNGIVEEGVEGAQLDALLAAYPGAAGDPAAIAGAARIELLDGAGRPALQLGSGQTVRVRITDFAAPGAAGSVDRVTAMAGCGGQADLESLVLTEQGGASSTFETSLTFLIGSAVAGNGRVECAAAGGVQVIYADATGAQTLFEAQLGEAGVAFVDGAGRETIEVFEGRRALLQVRAAGANLHPTGLDTVTATLQSVVAQDQKNVTLRETSVASGIFERAVWIGSGNAGGLPQLQVGGGSGADRDQVVATFAGGEASAEVLAGRLRLLDAAGRELQTLRPDSSIYVELEAGAGDPAWPDYLSAEVRYRGSVVGSASLHETGPSTGLYRGSVSLANIYLQTGQWLGIYCVLPAGSLGRMLPITADEIHFLDSATLQPVDGLTVGRPLTVEVVRAGSFQNPNSLEQLTATVSSLVGGDRETLTLTETSFWTGVFRGSLPLRSAPATTFDGTLQANTALPFGDTVRVELDDWFGSTATASLRPPSVRLLDAEGRATTRIVHGRRYQVEVEDAAFDLHSASADALTVQLLSVDGTETAPGGPLDLQETGLATAVFRAPFMVVARLADCRSNLACLIVEPGQTLVVRHQLAGGGVAEAAAAVTSQALALVDGQGRSLVEALESAPLRIRLTDSDQQPELLESRTVLVASRLGGDVETLTVRETAAASGIFEAVLPTRYAASAGQEDDGELTLSADPLSDVATGEQVVVSFDPGDGSQLEAAWPTAAARLAVLDGSRPATSVGGYPLRLRLECPTLAAAGQPASFEVQSTAYGDQETFAVATASGGVFTLEVPIVYNGLWFYHHPGDGVVTIANSGEVIFKFPLPSGHGGELRVTLPVPDAQLRFLDAVTGEPLDEPLDLRPFKIQLIEHESFSYEIETRNLTLRSALAGDLEQLQLVETTGNSAVYEAVVTPRIESGSPQPGIFEVSRRFAAGGLYDEVRAGAQTAWGEITATLPLAGPRIAFTDAAGRPAATVAIGDLAYFQVDDPLHNQDPGQADQLTVVVADTSEGFGELATLVETGAGTGIFRGTLPVTAGPRAAGNGALEPQAGLFVSFAYQAAPGAYLIEEARVVASRIVFLDAAGAPTTTYTEGDTLRLRLYDADPAYDPTQVDAVQVSVESTPWGHDFESVTLVETGAGSGIFEGSLASLAGPATSYDGILETGRGSSPDTALASFGEASAEASFQPARLRFFDRLGREITRITGNQTLYFETTATGGDPQQIDQLSALAEHLGSPYQHDVEHPLLVETGPATGLFRGQLPIEYSYPSENDGRLEVDPYSVGQIRVALDGGGPEGTLDLIRNQLPTASSDNLALTAGESATIDVLANDYDWEGGPLTLGAAFGGPFTTPTVNADGTLTVSAAENATGVELVTYLVSDADGAIVEGQVYVFLRGKPVVTIQPPPDGTVFQPSQAIYLNANAVDGQGNYIGYDLVWTSDRQGWLGDGPNLYLPAGILAAGQHLITASVTDYAGNVASATLPITILGPSTLEMTNPSADGQWFQVVQGTLFTFTAIAHDGAGVDRNTEIRWSSDTAFLGSGPSVEVDLFYSSAHPVITAYYFDSTGNPVMVSRPINVNHLPYLHISAPAPGARLEEGASLEAQASFFDGDGDPLTLTWQLDGQPAGEGETLLLPSLAAGQHELALTADDGHGGERRDSVTFTVRTRPVVTIRQPLADAVLPYLHPASFAATATSFEGADLSAELAWVTESGVGIGYGANVSFAGLPPGPQVVVAWVRDADGLIGIARTTVLVNANPFLYFGAPQSGSVFAAGQPIRFEAYANDPEDGDLSPGIQWSSSRDGVIGIGSVLTSSALSAGVHVITAKATDQHGGSDSISTTITVEVLGNRPPDITLLSPAPQSVVGNGDTLTFSATATDPESGDVSAMLVWSSNLQGQLGTGPSFTARLLVTGNHIIFVKATDPQGLAVTLASSVVVKTVGTATFVSAGPLDGFVLESGEDSNVGGLASTGQLRLGDNLADRQYRSFLSFDTASLPDQAQVRKATLRLMRSGTTGVNPATTHGDLSVDVKTGFFGASTALENADFESPATVAGTCLLTPATANQQWSTSVFDAAGRAAISLDGTTQLRLQLAQGDDDDATNDYLDHYGGESTVASTRPQLVVEYLLP